VQYYFHSLLEKRENTPGSSTVARDDLDQCHSLKPIGAINSAKSMVNQILPPPLLG
jgi:hypothetical protein